jgi:hypothetical protein
VYDYKAFVKGRWAGRTISDVFNDEFRAFSREYITASLAAGRITVSGKRVDGSHVFTLQQELSHVCHRHEPPVLDVGKPEILLEVLFTLCVACGGICVCLGGERWG